MDLNQMRDLNLLYNVLETHIESGLHGVRRKIMDVYAVATLSPAEQYRLPPYLLEPCIKKNDLHGHAEQNLVMDLAEKLIDFKTRNKIPFLRLDKIEILINFSPCAERCSKALCNFKLEMQSQGIYFDNFVVAFSQLYKIRRPSCVAARCSHKLCSEEEHKATLLGLHAMMNAGIRLETSNRGYWERLAAICYVNYVPQYDRDEEDYRLFNDLMSILYGS